MPANSTPKASNRRTSPPCSKSAVPRSIERLQRSSHAAEGKQSMAEYLNAEQIPDVLNRGSFDEFLGVVEDHQLECKKEPYQIQRDDQKQEFAKDVTALANVEGGFILIGVRTERNPTHFGDEITSIH